jgi:hypothetical protein
MFLMSKKALIDMNLFLQDIKQENNIFDLKYDLKEFFAGKFYKTLIDQCEEDKSLIYVQALTSQEDIGKKDQ